MYIDFSSFNNNLAKKDINDGSFIKHGCLQFS